MFYEYLKNIEGVAIFPVLGFFVFFIFFVAIVIHTIGLKKSDLKRMSEMPLADDSDSIGNTNL
jgi:hypothetical protein